MPVIKTFAFSYADLGYVWHKTEHKASFYFNGPGQTGSKVFPFGISLNSIYITHLLALFAV